MNRAEKNAGAAHRGLRLVSGGEGAENTQGHQAGLTGGAVKSGFSFDAKAALLRAKKRQATSYTSYTSYKPEGDDDE